MSDVLLDPGTIGRINRIQGDRVVITSKGIPKKRKTVFVKNYESLLLSDIVAIDQDDNAHVVWRSRSKDNVIITTNVCNQNCRFCPQPREGIVSSKYAFNSAILENLERDDISLVTITGGEPTLLGSDLVDIISKLLKITPKAEIAVLSNGMLFEDAVFAQRVVESGKQQLKICIPLHSDVPTYHDYVTGVNGSFERTSLGLLNLQRSRADIEIRIVLNRLNYRRLANIASSIGKNFPFVSHVAFMGLEVYSEAAEHINEVWIDPPEYMEQLSLAIRILQCRGISASIYNLPYCLVPESMWCYLCDSISFWKKAFLPLCSSCTKRPICPGLFASSRFQSSLIKQIVN
jgi:His-Xaa-Ser system radical SAM maturase HxsC